MRAQPGRRSTTGRREPDPTLSITEFAVLGVLESGPTHGFAVSKRLEVGSELGRVFTVRRPLAYRALDRLVGLGLAEPMMTEQGDRGPNRTVHRITPEGRRLLGGWLADPVEHIRDLRLEFLLKVALLQDLGRSPRGLVRAQREALQPTLAALDDTDPTDHVELWRHHNALAAARYLDALSRRFG